MTMQQPLAPVAAHDRIASMDILRGFALFGILLVNIEGIVEPFSKSISGTNPELTGVNYWADVAIYILAQGKFYPLFSLLFGMGFAVIIARAQAAGRNYFMLYLRRIVVLLGIGLVHGLFIRSGDVLTIYAVFGLILLLFFRNTPQSRLPKWGLIFYLAPAVLVMLGSCFGELAKVNPTAAAEVSKALAAEKAQMDSMIEDQRRAYGSGTYMDTVGQAAEDLKMVWGFMAFMGWQILGLFILGMWFVKSGAIARPATYRRLYSWLAWAGFPLGLAMMIWSFVLMPTIDVGKMDFRIGFASILAMAAGLLMPLGYLALIVKAVETERWAARLMKLAPAGRMALTNYLLQSVVCVMIFYNYGLGFYEQLSRIGQVAFVFLLFAIQLAGSNWWFKRFHFGPAEWLWRAFTYMKFPGMGETKAPIQPVSLSVEE